MEFLFDLLKDLSHKLVAVFSGFCGFLLATEDYKSALQMFILAIVFGIISVVCAIIEDKVNKD